MYQFWTWDTHSPFNSDEGLLSLLPQFTNDALPAAIAHFSLFYVLWNINWCVLSYYVTWCARESRGPFNIPVGIYWSPLSLLIFCIPGFPCLPNCDKFDFSWTSLCFFSGAQEAEPQHYLWSRSNFRRCLNAVPKTVSKLCPQEPRRSNSNPFNCSRFFWQHSCKWCRNAPFKYVDCSCFRICTASKTMLSWWNRNSFSPLNIQIFSQHANTNRGRCRACWDSAK